MNTLPKYRVYELKTANEHYWLVAEDDDAGNFNQDSVLATFEKSKFHAEIFCAIVNISHQQCRNIANI